AAVTVAAQSGAFVPVSEAIEANPDPADWLHISRTYNQHRFSPLNQINKGNVAQLRMAWSRGLPAGTQESTPIVYRGVMYVIPPSASIPALDAKTGKEVWKFYVTAAPGEQGGDSWGNVAVDQRAAGPWGLPGSYDPLRKVLYWGVANPNPYTRFKRHGSYDAVPLSSPA